MLYGAKVLFVLGVFCGLGYGFDHTHAMWNSWLAEYVTVNGPVSTVNYKKAKANPETLNAYLKAVEAVTKDQYAKFSEQEKLAFMINAYNAFTVRLILNHYPVKSIKDIGSIFKSAWKQKFFKILGEEQHLDHIEHEVIRKNFNEPRIHFSVVCASKGCPQLRAEAWVASQLETQFDSAARSFLSDSLRNRYDAGSNKFQVSKIFNWFESDFTKKHGTVQKFLAVYMGKDAAEQGKMHTAKLEYLDYDWTINETPAGERGVSAN